MAPCTPWHGSADGKPVLRIGVSHVSVGVMQQAQDVLIVKWVAQHVAHTSLGGDMVRDQTVFQVWSPRLLSVLRIITALLFIQHGTAKLFHIPHQAMFDNLQLMSLMGLQGVLEAGGGLLLLIGLFSRLVAFVLSGDMAVAYFMAHWPKNWWPILNGGDLAVLFCFVFLYLFVAGPGPWSIDAQLRSGTSPNGGRISG
jgi:putative oxidoreductase